MRIYLNEIKETAKELRFSEEDAWVSEVLSSFDEHQDAPLHPRSAKAKEKKKIDLQITVRKVDDLFILTGKIASGLNLLCSRCGDPFPFALKPSFTLLFTRNPTMAGDAYLDQASGFVPSGRRYGKARHTHDEEDETLVEMSASEAADSEITLLSEDYIDLKDILTEQVQLQVPLQPLPVCHGDFCSHCGVNLKNVDKLKNDNIEVNSPFSVLKGFKVKGPRS